VSEGGGGGGTSRQHCTKPLDREGMSVGSVAHDEPREVCRWPPPLYIHAGDWGPQTIVRLSAPDQGASQGPFEPLDSIGVETNLTFSPLISTLLLTLYFILYSFHHELVYRACFIVIAQLPIESDSHYTLFYFETNSVTFGPLMILES
jgi:hypothetical protein